MTRRVSFVLRVKMQCLFITALMTLCVLMLSLFASSLPEAMMPELGSKCHSRTKKSQIAYTDLILSCLQPPYTQHSGSSGSLQWKLQVRHHKGYAVMVISTFQQATGCVHELSMTSDNTCLLHKRI